MSSNIYLRLLKEKSMKNVSDFNDLIKSYKTIFPIFFLESNLSSSSGRRMARLSSFFKKHIFLFTLFNVAFVLCILPLIRYSTKNFHVAHINTDTIIVLNIVSTLIAISPFFLHYYNFNNLWFELKSVNEIIHKRLHHKINFQRFLHSFYLSVSSLLSIFIGYALLKSIFAMGITTIQFRVLIFTLKLIYLYIELHAIFIISLFQYTYEMFGKYVNFAYHLNRSNLVFSNNNNNIYDNLKFYNEIHYRLWTSTHEINQFFGLSIVVFNGQAFFDVSYSIYFMFHYWDNDYITWLPRTISIFPLECCIF